MLTASYSLMITAIAFLFSMASLPLVMNLATRWGLVDLPAHRKIHNRPIPYLGGMAIFIGISAAILVFFNNSLLALTAPETQKLLSLMAVGLLAAASGLLDDKFQIRARYKLAIQTLIVSVFAIFCYRFQILRIPGIDPIALPFLEIPLTVLWMLTVINGINLIDGVDGLAGAVSAVILLMIGVNAAILHDRSTQAIVLAGLGATAGFLILNWRPARIFLGESGSAGLGTLIAAALVSLGNSNELRLLADPALKTPSEAFPFQIPAATILASYPFLEVTITVVRRTLRGKSIGSADKGHIHHKLSMAGWNPQMISIVAATVTFASGCIVFTLLAYSRGVAAWLLVLTGGMIGILLHFCGYIRSLHPDSIRSARPHFIVANQFISMQKTRLNLAGTLDDALGIIAQTLIEFGVDQYQITLQPRNSHSRDGHGEVLTWKRPENASIQFLALQLATTPESATGSLVDRISMTDSKSHAVWHFLARQIAESIDTEHRVLLNGFMRSAIRALENLSISKQNDLI